MFNHLLDENMINALTLYKRVTTKSICLVKFREEVRTCLYIDELTTAKKEDPVEKKINTNYNLKLTEYLLQKCLQKIFVWPEFMENCQRCKNSEA